MTLKEAKKILKKEGFYLIKFGGPSDIVDNPFSEYESPEIYEARDVVNSAGYGVGMHNEVSNERKARLKKEYEKDTKDTCSGEEQPKEGNHALKEAASQFNDALLDEQAKKIEELTKDKELMKKATLSQLDDFIEIYNLLTKESQKAKRLGKEITRLNKAIHKKNMKIEELRKESSRHLRGKIKVFYENVDLEKMLKDKDAVLSDVAEELRLSKIREKSLTELCQKYVKANEELKEKLANNVVGKIDAQALKSAESALAYKEKVIAEKDEVIADLGKELAATKKELEEKTNLVEMVRKGSKEYREYGIAALSMIRKMAKVIVNGGPVSSKEFKEYRRLANGYSFNPQLPDFSEEEEKKLEHAKKIRVSSDNEEEGADQSGKIVICGKDFGKLLKENEESAEELSKVLNDVIDQFLLFGEIIIKSEK